MQRNLSRRQMLACTREGLGAGTASIFSATATVPAAETAPATPEEPFRYCLNTGTLRGHKLPLADEVGSPPRPATAASSRGWKSAATPSRAASCRT